LFIFLVCCYYPSPSLFRSHTEFSEPHIKRVINYDRNILGKLFGEVVLSSSNKSGLIIGIIIGLVVGLGVGYIVIAPLSMDRIQRQIGELEGNSE